MWSRGMWPFRVSDQCVTATFALSNKFDGRDADQLWFGAAEDVEGGLVGEGDDPSGIHAANTVAASIENKAPVVCRFL